MSLTRRLQRPLVRTGLALLLCAVMVVLIGLVFLRYWSALSSDSDVVRAERRGVAYLQPLSRLLGELTEAQSGAVRGSAVDIRAVQNAVREVDGAQSRHGAALATGQRWSDLRGRIDGLLSADASGRSAYDAYTDATTSTLALMRRIGDTSKLVLDPELDSRYLMDAALVRLPDVLLHAGRAADLSVVGDDERTAAALAVARNRVATSAGEVVAGSRTSIETSSRATLGRTLTPQLDQFQSAVDRMVPPVVIDQLAVPVSATELPELSRAVREAAVPLATTVLGELDVLLRQRQDALDRDRLVAAAAAVVVVLVGVLLLLLLVAARRSADESEAENGAHVPSIDEPERDPRPDLVDARDLLIEELIHVGRAVRPQGRGRDDDAE